MAKMEKNKERQKIIIKDKTMLLLKELSENQDDESFDIKLTGKTGEIMYFVDIIPDNNKKNANGKECIKSRIIRTKINKIAYKSGMQTVIMFGKDMNGEEYVCIQEYFFGSYDEAKDAKDKLLKAYEDGKNQGDIYELFEEIIKIKYRYLLEFGVKPYDIILEKNYHFNAEAVEVLIEENNKARFAIVPTSEHIYIKGKRVLPANDFTTFSITTI